MMEENYPINRPVEKQPTHRLGLWFLIPLSLGMIVLFVLSFEWKESLKIQRVVVQGSRIIPAQKIFTLANVPSKSVMCVLNVYDVQQRVLSQPFIKSVRVNRQFPNTLSIVVVEREPIASLSGDSLRYVDADGVMLPYIQSPVQFDIPMINGIDGLQSEQPGKIILNQELFTAINILQTASAIDSMIYHMISEVNMNNGDDIVLYSTDSGVPIKIGRGEFSKKLLVLQTFWNNFIKTGDAAKLGYVDLRFDGQVVVKWNQQSEAQTLKLPL
jgi:cell division protein FtsQ